MKSLYPAFIIWGLVVLGVILWQGMLLLRNVKALPYPMRLVHFGEAITEIPDEWRTKVVNEELTVAGSPDEKTALLWMWTLRRETPDQPGHDPAEDFFRRKELPKP